MDNKKHVSSEGVWMMIPILLAVEYVLSLRSFRKLPWLVPTYIGRGLLGLGSIL